MDSIKRFYGILLFLGITLSFLLHSERTQASHAAGMDLTYECLGGNQYRFQISFYRFCEGIDEPNSISLDIESQSCNIEQSLTLDKTGINQGQDITPFCNSVSTTCETPPGSFPGIEWYEYSGTTTLPAQCPDWELNASVNARHDDITTIDDPDSESIHVSATLDNQNYPCNSSPTFNNHPIAYFCSGDSNCFNHGVTEPDGDSLSYRLVTPTTGPNSTVDYLTPYSATQPLQGSVSINDSTGTICVSPTQPDVTPMEVEVVEWRNGDSIGVVHRDLQFSILDCSPYEDNTVPSLGGINDSNYYNMTVCENDSVDFTIPSYDLDVDTGNQNVTLSWNQGIPSGTFDPGTDSLPTARFRWQPDSSDAGATHCFTVEVEDDACPLKGTQTQSFCIDVLDTDSTFQSTGIDYGSGTFCYDAGTVTPTISGQQNGTFYSEPQGLDLDTNTGEIDIDSSVADSSYMVYYETPDSLLCSKRDSVPFTIDSGQVPDFHYTDTSYCETDPSVIHPTFLNGGSEGIFWADDPSSLEVDSTFGTVDIPNSDTGEYKVYNKIPASGSCPQRLDSAVFIVEPQPFVEAGDDTAICEGEQFTLDGSYWRGASSATWTTEGDGSFSNSTDTNASYTHAPGDVGTGSFDNVITSDSIDACNVDRDTMTLIVREEPSLSIAGDDTICADEEASVNGSISGHATGMSWSTSGDGFFDDVSSSSTVYHPGSDDEDSGTITIHGETVGSGVCDNGLDSMELTVLPLPDPSFHYDSTEFCIQNLDELDATIEGDAGGVFTADPPGGLDLDSSTGSIDLTESYADNFFVTYSVEGQCSNDTTVQLDINPTPDLPHPNVFEVCPGETDTLSLDGNPDSVVWYGDQDANEVLGTDREYVPPVSDFDDGPGNYTYYVRTIEEGCISPLGAGTVTSHSDAEVNLNSDPDPAIGTSVFDLTLINGSGQHVVDYDWDFGNGDQTHSFDWTDTLVTYEEVGEYTISISARDSSTGCSGSDLVEVEVTEKISAKLPNVFTPNGDGENDEFKPRLVTCPEENGNGDEEENMTCWSGIESFTGKIFNRWGNEVHRWSDWGNAWEGEGSPEGTYFYTIEATGENGEKVEYKGKVTLLRNGR